MPLFNSVAKKVLGWKKYCPTLAPARQGTPVPSILSLEVCISLTVVAADFSKTFLPIDQSAWCHIQQYNKVNIEHYMSLTS